MTPGRDQTVELLHALGHLYARHSQPKRGLVLRLIAARLAPNDEGVLRTLAEAFLRSRSLQAAAEVIERLQSLGGANQPVLDLLRSRALWLAGTGLVVFLIITIAQFVVITKGGERVAEVATRFSLDAMPGKQMAIDNDLRSGDIDQAEANRLRRVLERESHLFGAMEFRQRRRHRQHPRQSD
jgi:hypothetical protein